METTSERMPEVTADNALIAAIAAMQREARKARKPLSLVCVDVRLPIVAGRQELCERLAARASRTARGQSVVAWTGEHELVLLLPGTGGMMAELTAQRIEELAPKALAGAGAVAAGTVQDRPGLTAERLLARGRRAARSAGRHLSSQNRRRVA